LETRLLTRDSIQLSSSLKIIAGIAAEDAEFAERNARMLKAITELKIGTGQLSSPGETTEAAS
jgi:hypothetical protein